MSRAIPKKARIYSISGCADYFKEKDKKALVMWTKEIILPPARNHGFWKPIEYKVKGTEKTWAKLKV